MLLSTQALKNHQETQVKMLQHKPKIIKIGEIREEVTDSMITFGIIYIRRLDIHSPGSGCSLSVQIQ